MHGDLQNNQVDERDGQSATIFVCVLIVVMWLLMFWPVLIGEKQFGFRDTATLYFPLFEWIDRQWQAGEIPLWNPHCNLGQPVVQDGSSSVFYPGKALFFLRFLPYPVLFGWYVCVHVLLAAFGAMWCGRKFGCGLWGSGLAALGYGFGAPVVFQTCNVVFLVGAAWLPWALGCLWTFKNHGRWRYLVLLAICLSLMVLGGDPQMAYHVAMISVLVILFGQLASTKNGQESGPVGIRARCGFVLVLAAISFALSAIQVLPAAAWFQKSQRSAYLYPRNIYELAQSNTDDFAGDCQGIIGTPVANTHHDAIYQFSLPPWQIVDAVWPNILGRMNFAANEYEQRWANHLPGADRIWTPSVYCGLLVILLGLTQISFCRRDATGRFLSCLLVVFLLGSFGWYGSVWALNELSQMRGGTGLGPAWGDPVGGVYWLMVTLLPQYVSFRYPAKLIVIATLALVLLASRGFRHFSFAEIRAGQPGAGATASRRIWIALFALLISSSLVSTGLLLTPRAQLEVIQHSVFGIRDTRAIADVLRATLHTSLVALMLIGLNFGLNQNLRLFRSLLLIVTAAELFVATCSLYPMVDPVLPADMIVKLKTHQPRTIVLEQDWSDIENLDELVRRQQLFSTPKFHLRTHSSVIGSFSSVEPLDWQIWEQLNRLDADTWLANRNGDGAGMEAYDSISLESMTIGVVDGNSNQPVPRVLPIRRWGSLDRIRLVDRWEQMPAIDEKNIDEVTKRTILIRKRLQDHGGAYVVAEGNFSGSAVQVGDDVSVSGQAGSIDTVADDPRRIQLDVSVDSRALLVVADYYDENWRAFVTRGGQRQEVPVYRVNRLVRGIMIPAGQSNVEMVYNPYRLWIGAWISGPCWIGLLLGGGFMFVRRSK